MASLKSVRMKITGVKKTKQITKAMNMVSSAKLRGAQQRIESFRPYANKFYEVLENVAGALAGITHPLLKKREEIKKSAIVLVTSDRGLCGAFNLNIISAAMRFAREKEKAGITPVLYCIGRKGHDTMRKSPYEVALAITDHSTQGYELAMEIGSELIEDYISGKIDEVQIIHGEFVSVTKQTVASHTILPVAELLPKKEDEKPAAQEAKGHTIPAGDTIYEPEEELLLGGILPRFVKVQIHRAIVDTSASEHAARMTAMDNATRNCDEITQNLTLLYNKTRQAAITTDLIDIVGGAEALNG